MTLTGLARAAEMQPGNLRRMLMSTTASPQLGSVMRLLPPLQCQVDPAGARTAGELVAFLDAERRRQGWTWEQLLPPIGLDIDKTSASLSRPDRMSLDVFIRLADALHINLDLVDDPTSSKKYPGPTANDPRPAAAPTAPERSAPHEAATISAPHPGDELAAARAAIVVLQAELARQVEVREKAEEKAALASELLGHWIRAYTRKDQEYQQALKHRPAAEECAVQAQVAVEDHAEAPRDAAEHERAQLAVRLLAVESELAERRKVQADDAAYLTSLLHANRIPEAITFFARRVLGVPFEDADQAMDALEEQGRKMTPESTLLTENATSGPPYRPGVCISDSPAEIASDTGAPATAARDAAPHFDVRRQPEADPDVGLDAQPYNGYRPRFTPMRRTLISVPDAESASRWQPKSKRGGRDPL